MTILILSGAALSMTTPVPSIVLFSLSPITTSFVISETSNVPNAVKKWIVYVPIISAVVFIGIIIIAVILLIFVGKNYYFKRQLKNAFVVSVTHKRHIISLSRIICVHRTCQGQNNLNWLPADNGGPLHAFATPKVDEWEIPPRNVVAEKELGEGYFGRVFQGTVKGPLPNSKALKNSICVTVAIKFLKSKSILVVHAAA